MSTLTLPRMVGKGSQKSGLPPGSLVYVGAEKTEPVQITRIEYSEDYYEESAVDRVEDSLREPDEGHVVWINVSGVHEPGVVEKFGKALSIHPLALEDVMNTSQRSKAEEYESQVFVVLKRLYLKSGGVEIGLEQISFLLFKNIVLTFQENPEDDFEPVRQRLRHSRGRIRKRGADILLYALTDAVVDNYYVVIEKIGEEVEELEERMDSSATPETIRAIQKLKRKLILIHKAIWPVHETLNRLVRGESSLIAEDTRVYLIDVMDHSVQVTETLDIFRDLVIDLMSAYLSFNSHRLNETMKALTLVSTIFIPLTFIAGVYGMNFLFMPELTWKYGYFLILALMAAVGFSMLWLFKRRDWL